MGLDAMRGAHGRCPPFLVGGLIIICIILMCNWWSLSSQNYDLLKQLEEMGEQLRLCSSNQDSCQQMKSSVEARLKNTEDEVANLRVQLDKEIEEKNLQLKNKDKELHIFKDDKEKADHVSSTCNKKLSDLVAQSTLKDNTIDDLQKERDKYREAEEQKKKEVENIMIELEKVRTELNTLKAIKPEYIQNQRPDPQTTSVRKKKLGELSELHPKAVEVRSRGLQGMKFHGGPVLILDPPNAPRPKPRFSVTYLKGKTEPTNKSLDNVVNLLIGQNREQPSTVLEQGKDERDGEDKENHAGEVIGENTNVINMQRTSTSDVIKFNGPQKEVLDIPPLRPEQDTKKFQVGPGNRREHENRAANSGIFPGVRPKDPENMVDQDMNELDKDQADEDNDPLGFDPGRDDNIDKMARSLKEEDLNGRAVKRV